MAEIVLGTFADEAELILDTDRTSCVVVTLRITLDDRAKIRALVETLGDWLAYEASDDGAEASGG